MMLTQNSYFRFPYFSIKNSRLIQKQYAYRIRTR